MASPSALPLAKHFNITSPSQYVAHVEINRPAKLNSFFDEMWFEFQSIFNSLSVNPEIRAIIISGAGDRAFTTGLDVSAASSPSSPLTANHGDPARNATHLRRHITELQSTISSAANCDKPTICLMHGYCFGLAIDLSSACDIRLCSADAKFCVKEVDIGLAADVGTLSRLPKTMGITSFVKEVCLTARVWGAEEAVANKFVSRVVSGGKGELMKEGLKLAELIAAKSPVAVAGTKNILDAAWGRTVEDNLNYTAVWNSAMLQSKDVEVAMMSGLKKRSPTFEKL